MEVTANHPGSGEHLLHGLGLGCLEVQVTDLHVRDVALLLQELEDGIVDDVLLAGQKEPANWNPNLPDT